MRLGLPTHNSERGQWMPLHAKNNTGIIGHLKNSWRCATLVLPTTTAGNRGTLPLGRKWNHKMLSHYNDRWSFQEQGGRQMFQWATFYMPWYIASTFYWRKSGKTAWMVQWLWLPSHTGNSPQQCIQIFHLRVMFLGYIECSLDPWSFWILGHWCQSDGVFVATTCLVNLFQWRAIVAQQIVHLGVGGWVALDTAYHKYSAQFTPKKQLHLHLNSFWGLY